MKPQPDTRRHPTSTVRCAICSPVDDLHRHSRHGCHTSDVPPRFLQLADVAEILNISSSQAYALVRNGDIKAVKIGGRGQWRVEASALESYIAKAYAETEDFIRDHPFTGVDGEESDGR